MQYFFCYWNNNQVYIDIYQFEKQTNTRFNIDLECL